MRIVRFIGTRRSQSLFLLSRQQQSLQVLHQQSRSLTGSGGDGPNGSKKSNGIFSYWEKKIGASSGGLPDWIEKWNRDKFYKVGVAGGIGAGCIALTWGKSVGSLIVISSAVGYWVVGLNDIRQKAHTIRRNFPVLGNLRYLLESIRPEIQQYFIEGDQDTTPFSREQRAIVYQRAKGMQQESAFGTRRDTYTEGYEWISHSMFPKIVKEDYKRVTIGGDACKQPYSASRLNISAMSYGALSGAAILALGSGAKMGNFWQNTGEGGISRFHLENGNDIVWNIGTGYFGCRDPKTGGFCPEQFRERATLPNVKMIEIKLSQGAKPAHGGKLPGVKVTKFIAEARGIKIGETCDSPNFHAAFSNPREMVDFIDQLRELSGGKPIGFKTCLGKPAEFCAIIAACNEAGIYPDFITIDGGEGGTGAAPPEFANHVGWPLMDALMFANNILIGAGCRDKIKIIASGKVLSAFSMVRTTALGADVLNSARGMMFAIGCIQSLKCHTNKCPTGITTQDPELVAGLDVESKSHRVFRYHKDSLKTFFEIVGGCGLENPSDLNPSHIMRRMAGGTYCKSLEDVFPTIEPGSLLDGSAADHPVNIQQMWNQGVQSLRGQRMKSIPLYHGEHASSPNIQTI